MHDGHTAHTLRSHRMSELQRMKDNGTVVASTVCGRIVDIRMGNDGAPGRITIHDGLGNYYSLPSIAVLEPVDDA